MDIEYGDNVVDTKYFFLNNFEMNTLQTIDIPIAKLKGS